MIIVKTYRGHIRNWEELCERLGIDLTLSREEREHEILIKAYQTWGCEMADHMHGMFAFALWDEEEQKLFCLRDQFGTKPFYYYETEDGELLYGTMIRDIIDQPGFKKELNEEMLQLYLSLTYVAGENTFFRGLKKLLPGRYLIWQDGKLEIHRYWKPEFHPDESKTLEDWADEIHNTLKEIMPEVKTADERVESFLSGGVDSSYVLAMSDAEQADCCGYEEERFDDANRTLTKTNLFVNRAMTFMMPVMMLVMNGVSVLIVWTGAHGISDGQMQVGDMMAFIQYTMQIIMGFLMLCMISIMLPRAAVAADRVEEVLKSETMIYDPKQEKHFPEDGKGVLTFDHVSFRYPGADEDVLEDITFTAKPGETTAIIGSTGSGKSTLVNLIPRFYDVTSGDITLDGVDIREVKQHELREKLGYVPQKGVLFSGDIASNIMFGNSHGSDDEMIEAAEIAQATEFIDTKPEKYKSPISQGGSNVSGGQKQRLSIARAIAKHPQVFIFDDSFSALDYKTDVTLRRALAEKTSGSTVLIVAQRISTILHADQIIVLDDGQIVGKGTHKELLKNCEAYYQIASSQLSEKELEEDLKEVESYAKR